MNLLPQNKVCIIDAYNMIHRCRFDWGGGLATGEYQIVFNFFRTLKSLLEELNPSKVYFPLDGKPVERISQFADYKANRKIETEDPEQIAYWESFHRQKRIIINTIKDNYPMITLYHPHLECDDLIYHISTAIISPEEEAIIISSDTDFIQIINKHSNITLYNPVSKSFREKTAYDYASWKSMVGDVSDNIPGVKGIGKKTAQKILETEGELEKRMASLKFKEEYEKSFELINLKPLSEEIKSGINTYGPNPISKDFLLLEFEKMGFKTMIKESYINNYYDVFSRIQL